MVPTRHPGGRMQWTGSKAVASVCRTLGMGGFEVRNPGNPRISSPLPPSRGWVSLAGGIVAGTEGGPLIRVARVVLAAVAAAVLAIAAPGPSAAAEGHLEKAARLVEKLGYPELLRTLVRSDIEKKAKGDPKKAEELLAK